jgi:hypothetical protein
LLAKVDAAGDGTNDHGATTEHGEVLEWYTVLAEYQFRKQLTWLSNAVSCIVGDFDAISTDCVEVGDSTKKSEGTLSVGIFNFEKAFQMVDQPIRLTAAITTSID